MAGGGPVPRTPFTYGYGSGDINGAAASFCQWGMANGTWRVAAAMAIEDG